MGVCLYVEVIILVTAFSEAAFWAWKSSFFLLCVSPGHPNELSSMGSHLAETKLIFCFTLSLFFYYHFLVHINHSALLTLCDMFSYPASHWLFLLSQPNKSYCFLYKFLAFKVLNKFSAHPQFSTVKPLHVFELIFSAKRILCKVQFNNFTVKDDS